MTAASDDQAPGQVVDAAKRIAGLISEDGAGAAGPPSGGVSYTILLAAQTISICTQPVFVAAAISRQSAYRSSAMCQHAQMDSGKLAVIFAVASVTTWASPGPLIDVPAASAVPCPDSEVVFARGTGEPTGVGGVGQAFIDALQSDLPGQSIGVYPVDYPAASDYHDSALAGAADASAHVENEIASCPGTRIVLGGYSQGAVVIDMTTDSVPPRTADHVAAVALFGNPSSSYASSLFGAPLPALAPAYRPKTIDLCMPDDVICAEGGNMVPHLLYVQSGMADDAASYVANRLRPSPMPAQ